MIFIWASGLKLLDLELGYRCFLVPIQLIEFKLQCRSAGASDTHPHTVAQWRNPPVSPIRDPESPPLIMADAIPASAAASPLGLESTRVGPVQLVQDDFETFESTSETLGTYCNTPYVGRYACSLVVVVYHRATVEAGVRDTRQRRLCGRHASFWAWQQEEDNSW